MWKLSTSLLGSVVEGAAVEAATVDVATEARDERALDFGIVPECGADTMPVMVPRIQRGDWVLCPEARGEGKEETSEPLGPSIVSQCSRCRFHFHLLLHSLHVAKLPF